MKKLFLILCALVLCSSSIAGTKDIIKVIARKNAAVVYDYGPEDFETTGTPTGDGTWQTPAEVGTATVDYDHTGTGLINGSESLEMDDSANDGYAEGRWRIDTAYATTMYTAFKMRFIGAINSSDSFHDTMADGGNELSQFRIDGSGHWECLNGASSDPDTSGTIDPAVGTLYYIWTKTVEGTGANGVTQLWVSLTGTKPGSPICSVENGTDTSANPNEAQFQADQGAILIVDDIIISETIIGNQ